MLGTMTSSPLMEKQCRMRLGSSLRSTSSVDLSSFKGDGWISKLGLAFKMKGLIFGDDGDADRSKLRRT